VSTVVILYCVDRVYRSRPSGSSAQSGNTWTIRRYETLFCRTRKRCFTDLPAFEWVQFVTSSQPMHDRWTSAAQMPTFMLDWS